MTLVTTAYKAANGYLSTLAAKYTETGKKNTRYLEHEDKTAYATRLDIKDWGEAEAMYTAPEPKSWPLQLILSNISKDALLSSQKENRIQQIFSSEIRLKKPNGETDEEQTEVLKKMPLYRFLTRASLESIYFEDSVVELSVAKTVDDRTYFVGEVIPRTNIIPKTGMFYPDYFDETKKVNYREMPEYGVWILEFWSKEMPLLNKAVPHVLFKRFAQSCWSELCEIFGIPPRVLKTNTQDKNMLARATKMMKDMGAASWFIIDEDEEFEFAQGASTNGDVYKNLITLCSNELCLLIVGAILAQDTKNGSRSKDQVAEAVLWLLVQSDMAMLEEHWNNIIIPAFKKHGLITGDVSFEFVPSEDINKLFEWVMQSLQYFEVDPDWFKEKFGIEITGVRAEPAAADKKEEKGKAKLSADSDFFGSARQRKSA